MKLRPFELALVIIFVVLAIAALVIMSKYKGDPNGTDGEEPSVGVVTIWGTVPWEAMNDVLNVLKNTSDAYKGVNYRAFSVEEFDDVLVNALADGIGPDLLLVSHEQLADLRHRIQPISYESFPRRDIQTLYLDGAQIFALNDGLYGYPVMVDPLMMYWNRDIMATEGFLEPPKTWESLVNNMFPSLIKRDFDRTINRSVVAMGEYGNVRNAFGVISALFIQGGSQGVIENTNSGYSVKLRNSPAGGDPLVSAIDFYTRFSKPSNTLYSWNRSFEEDRKQFISEDLVFYFGYGSEGHIIENLNPNLNFDTSEIPQGATATTRRTYGRFYAISMLKTSANKVGSESLMRTLSSSDAVSKIANSYNMVPAYKTLVSQGSNDTYGRYSYKSASISYGWLNPDPESSDIIFKTLTQDINENRRSTNEAVADSVARLSSEYK